VSRVRTRGGKVAVRVVLPAMLGLLATLPACGAGQVSQTADQASGVNGYTATLGDIAVRDASIAYTGQAKTSAIYRAGQAAQLDITLVNVGSEPDKLLSVSSPIAASGQIEGDGTIGGYQTIVIGNTDAGSDASSLAARTLRVQLTGLNQDILAGHNYPVVLVFQRAGVLNATLPVGYPTGPLAVRSSSN
jgi:copper(I)-binding protein